MKFVDVYSWVDGTAHLLYVLLGERSIKQSISHKKMPSFDEHIKFIRSRPYPYWYLIKVRKKYVGAIYLTDRREIGIGIFNDCRRNGYAETAIRKLMKLHPGKFLANINPKNRASIYLFKKVGFNRIQATYAKS